jgi:hypothetical protein
LVFNKTKIQQSFRFGLVMFISVSCLGQKSTAAVPDAQSTQSQTQSAAIAANPARGISAITVPAGTHITLVLMHPIQSRYVHRGDDIYAQTTSPVVAGNEVVIPPGTFVQGKVDKLARNGARAELYLQSMAVTFPDGYVAPIGGPLTLESGDGYALRDPGQGHVVGALALPAGGAGAGALIGHFAANSQPSTITNSLPPGCMGGPPECLSSSLTVPGSTAKGTIIGAAVGGAVGGVAALVLLTRSHNFFLDVGSPIEMVLQHPLSLEGDQVARAIKDAKQHPSQQEPVAPRPQILEVPNNRGVCYTPGNPGTPDIDIPGTPAVGDSPGTPATHIPGIPATPPTSYPCP